MDDKGSGHRLWSMVYRLSPRAPEEVDGDAGGEDGEAERAVERRLVEGRGDDERAGGGEERGREGVAGGAEAAVAPAGAVGAAEDEERERGQPEPDEVHRDDVVEYLLVAARDGDDGRERALQGDGRDGRARPRREPRDAAEEEAVLRHREVDARRRQHALAEKAERRDGDADRDEPRAR